MSSLPHYARLGLRLVANSGRVAAARFVSANAAGGGVKPFPIAAEQLSRRTAVPRLTSAYSGFPKDMLYGPSTALRRDGFGDDACFVAWHQTADVVGVADGVGGWRTYGVDPSRFARSLMRVCEQLVRDGSFEPHKPAALIADSYRELHRRAAKQRLVGSATACVVMLDRQSGRLHTANLGDSGFLVVRQGKIVHRSEEQTHYFNTPFQLSLIPDAEGGGFLSDSPESAQTTSIHVQEGDLILLATDGLFDNMPLPLIEEELAQLRQYDQDSIQRVCNSIALAARRLAFDRNHMSPFAEKAKSALGVDARGGKPDDITVIIAAVTTEEEKTEKKEEQ